MASRTGGRNDDRSNARGASAPGAGGSTAGRAPGAGGSAAGRASGAGGSTAGRATSSSSTNESSGTQRNTGTTGATNQSNANATSSGAAANASSTRADQERELRTSREQSTPRPGSTGQQQGANVHQQDYQTPFGGTPFAFMRRMMDDMDRIFSDFGFANSGLLSSGFFTPESWPNQQRSRALGTGTSRGSAVTPSSSGSQRGVQRSGQSAFPALGNLWSPQVEVFERGNNLVIRADLPGLSRDDVDVEIDDDALIIRGERHSDYEDEQEGYYRSERSYGSFYRAIPLPDGIDANACNASFKDGVLQVTLPKPPQQQSRAKKIDVR